MPVRRRPVLSTLLVATALLAAGHGLQAQKDGEPPANSIAASAGAFTARRVFWQPGQSAADFLETAGQHIKVRWRTLYRPQPPTPTPDRHKAAFTLGSLLGEGLLILQAGDAQQFRNNNQDVVTYCRMLGLGERMMPRLMTQAKMAESSEWKELRQELAAGQQELIQTLREQKDEDLAILVDLGVWMRSLEIASTLAVASPDLDIWPLCIGSPALLNKLSHDFATLSPPSRESALLKPVHETLAKLTAVWNKPDTGPPTQYEVTDAHERFKKVMEEMTLK
jgi:hypothetical protein